MVQPLKRTFLVLETAAPKIDDLDCTFVRTSQQHVLESHNQHYTSAMLEEGLTSGFRSQCTIR